ncbi:MAG: hypothetical protein AABZ64_12870 [Nitrospinota bacterium]
MTDTSQPQGQTRREFIRKVLLTTAYAAPVIASFSIGGVATGQPATGIGPEGTSPGQGGTPPGQAKMDSPMRGSPMRMMSPMEMMSPMRMGNPGNIWK